MPMNQIKRWNNGEIICQGEEEIKFLAEKNKANLRYANLRSANLRYANLRYADLRYADLRSADLSSADLSYADLSSADLSYAKNIEFYLLPSLGSLSKIHLSNLSDDLQLELMRRDAQSHPYPELFDKWKETRECPYRDEERYWLFDPNPKLWEPGKPEMNDFELILAICKSQGWKIKKYLK